MEYKLPLEEVSRVWPIARFCLSGNEMQFTEETEDCLVNWGGGVSFQEFCTDNTNASFTSNVFTSYGH